ncbi:MAG: T9SS type A sorting domain-containing protein, partial [Candidatus Aegiribacteria sp.]|nr:T9SS type A sorting domain-containing protein [Candidatus Aegiribacteria sp.]
THGEIEYTVPELAEGSHRIILVVWDGMGNSTRDTLDFVTAELSTELLSSVFVYPNPGSGQRCFSFETATSGTARITVYTISGRAIWRKTVSCGEGYNQIIWDGLDTDGDEPASGAYIFRIEFSDSKGASSSVTDILAVIRQSGR